MEVLSTFCKKNIFYPSLSHSNIELILIFISYSFKFIVLGYYNIIDV